MKSLHAKIIKIHAEGTNKRFMTLCINGDMYKSVRISDELYCYLKDFGVPTSQYLRYHKHG